MDDSEREIAELCGGCILAVEQATGMKLDFTPETLPILDHYLMGTGDAASHVGDLVAAMSGAYFGEVVRRHLGPARWFTPEGEPESYALEFDDVFLSFNPLGVAAEAITRAPRDGIGANLAVRPSERERVEASLELLGGAREDDYFRLAVRFEAIEQVVHTLAALESAREPKTKYGPEAYARVRGRDAR